MEFGLIVCIRPAGDKAVPLSIWVVGDVDDAETGNLFIEALSGMVRFQL